MSINLDKYREDISKLIKKGDQLLKILKGDNNNLLKFREGYECWYSEAFYLIKTVLSGRLVDFQNYYENKKGDSLKKAITYTPPESYGLSIDTRFAYKPPKQIDIAKSLFINQLNILKSAQSRFESSLFDIRSVLQADLFDSELDAARELLKHGFLRAAGAIAGVVLEKHFAQVCINHKVAVSKKDPSISDCNDLLKKESVLQVTEWRFIQRLGDLRNLCDHNKDREPTKEEVEELINGVEKITKTLF